MRNLSIVLSAVVFCSGCLTTRSASGPDIRYALVKEQTISCRETDMDLAMLRNLRRDIGSDFVFFEHDGAAYLTTDTTAVLYVQQRVSRIDDSFKMMRAEPLAWEREPSLFVPSVSVENSLNDNRSGVPGAALARHETIEPRVSSVTFLQKDIMSTDLEIRQRLEQALRDHVARPVGDRPIR